MPSGKRRSWQDHKTGRALFTLLVEPHADALDGRTHRGLADLIGQLLELFDAHRFPASWAVGDPLYAAATPIVRASRAAHEIALLGDPSWLGAEAGRPRFAHELSRRLHQSRAASIPVQSLVPRGGDIAGELDLVVKLGITAVCGNIPAGISKAATPQQIHYGVWDVPSTAGLPGRRGLWRGTGALRRALRRAASQAGLFHLVVDVPAIESAVTPHLNALARLLNDAGQLRNRGMLAPETLSGLAAGLSHVPAATPQRSILRRAA